MKRVLIISPYFPPSNAADMQRVRMSLPYFKEFGWEATVVTVDSKYSEVVKDDLLMESIPADITIYSVKAFSKNISKKIGFGSLGFRSLWYYAVTVNRLLRKNKFDLIYFSTTQFPVCVLGPYWNRKFGVPYVIDMQDPWYSDYYDDKPKAERPPKYKLVYATHKKLEAKAMEKVGGLISVSENYLRTLQSRYPNIGKIPQAVITFGAFGKDFDLVKQHSDKIKPFDLNKNENIFNCVYVGRGGHDMETAVGLLFEGFKIGLANHPALFSEIRFYFLGTSYAPNGQGKPTILPLAQQFGITDYVVEQTDRLPFYESIAVLLAADALLIPGSNSPGYTASKIYPYIMANKPLLSIFHQDSEAVNTIKRCLPEGNVVTFLDNHAETENEIAEMLKNWVINRPSSVPHNAIEFDKFSAKEMTAKQVALFNSVLTGS